MVDSPNPVSPLVIGTAIVAFAVGVLVRLPFDQLVELVGLSLAGHVTIAWSAIAYHARKQEVKWEGKLRGEFLPESVDAVRTEVADRLEPVMERVGAMGDLVNAMATRVITIGTIVENLQPALERRLKELPTEVLGTVAGKLDEIDLQAEINAWLQTDEAKRVIGSALVTAADVTKDKLQSWLEGVHGNAVKDANASAGKSLLTELAAQDLGNPVLNGIWAIGVRAAGPKILGRLAGWARGRGIDLAPEDWRELGVRPPAEGESNGGGRDSTVWYPALE